MKKSLLLITALALAGASSLLAGTIDVYITGSTAFRANVFWACSNLFVSPSIYFGNAAHGGADSGFTPKTASWVMTGTPITTLTNLQGNTLNIHGLFTGSIQGLQTVENGVKLAFPKPVGTAGGLCSDYVTNTPTIGFSDASGTATPYPADGTRIVEEDVCVQPFVFVKSVPTSGAVTNISNVTWEQLTYGIPAGRIPLAAWTGKIADTNTFVYLLQRTKDSGTRRCETQGQYLGFGEDVGIYLFDYTNHFWYQPTTLAATANASSPNGVVGPAGVNNANVSSVWSYGYVGGGDIANSLKINDVNNQAIAALSIGDAQGVGSGNWGNVVSLNGLWPTAAGSGLHGNTGTNDYSPITLGYYPFWGYEVLVYPPDPQHTYNDQNMTSTQMGSQSTPGSFMGVFNAKVAQGVTPIVGSIDREIEVSKTGSPGATAIRLCDMLNQRANVGATIAPPWH